MLSYHYCRSHIVMESYNGLGYILRHSHKLFVENSNLQSNTLFIDG